MLGNILNKGILFLKSCEIVWEIQISNFYIVVVVVVVVVELSYLALMLFKPGTYGREATLQGNKSHKHMYEPNSNIQPWGLHHTALTNALSEHTETLSWHINHTSGYFEVAVLEASFGYSSSTVSSAYKNMEYIFVSLKLEFFSLLYKQVNSVVQETWWWKERRCRVLWSPVYAINTKHWSICKLMWTYYAFWLLAEVSLSL